MNFRYIVLSAFVAMMTVACTTYETPGEIAGGTVIEDSVALTLTRRVLWVNIDGAVGSVVKSMTEDGKLPTIKRMLEHSKFSWTGLADSRLGVPDGQNTLTEDPLTWASMITGVSANLHFIHDASYSPDYKLTGSLSQKVTIFPTIVQYISKNDQNVAVSCVTPWADLNRYLGDAKSSITTEGDAQTFQTLKDQLADDDFRLTITSFRGVLDAGRANGFAESNTDYASALATVDNYLSELLSVIEQRKNADYEDWLVVVTSNVGGTATKQTYGSSDAERDIFGLFYYPHYTSHEMKGETITSPTFNDDSDIYAYIPDTMALYALKDKTFALEFNLRMMPKSDGTYSGGNWDKIIGKNQWGLFRQRSTISYRLNSNPALQEAVTSGNDCLWHHYYMAVDEMTGGTRNYQISADGQKKLYASTQAGSGLDKDSSFLYIGYGNVPTAYNMVSVRLWTAMLDDPTIEALSGEHSKLPSSHPNYANLIGEWVLTPENMATDTTVNNTIPGMPELYFSRPPQFIKTANTLPDKLASGNIMMENTLIAPQILYWLFGSSAVDSRMEGYNFLKAYALEEQWRDME